MTLLDNYDVDRPHNIGSSFPIPSILTIVFVVLKLVGTINWSWLWVLSPLWLSAGFGLAIFIIIFTVIFISIIVKKK